MPNYHGYETVVDHYMAQWDHATSTPDGKSNIAKDPAFAEMLTYQKNLVDSARRLPEAGEVPQHLR